MQERTEEQIDILIKQCLNIGEEMYCVGAEIRRIEDTLHRIGKSYGADHVNVYAITSYIVVTMEFPGFPAFTQSRRIYRREASDFYKLQKFVQLSRDVEKEPLPVLELRERVGRILSQKRNRLLFFLGEVLTTFGFAVFFGGNFYDAMIAAGIACILYLLEQYFAPLCQSRIFANFFMAFVAGIIPALISNVPGLHSDMIMIGDIMIMIPGVAVTNSIRYTLRGDLISGLEKLIDSILQTCAIAGGFLLAIFLFGGVR